MEKKVLGKGLEALIPKKISESQEEFAYLSLEKISPNEYQPRKKIEKKELEELSRSIKEKGLLQPIVVRKKGEEKFEIVVGERRYQAAKLLKMEKIPAIIRDVDDKNAFLLALVENLQRKDLNPIEEAEAFQKLINDFQLTQEETGRIVGKDKTSISNTLRLLKLPEEIKQALREGKISRSQARTILGIEDEKEQKELFTQVIREKLPVQEIEIRVKRKSKKRPLKDPFVARIEEKLQEILGTKVRISNRRNNRGKIIIDYYDLKDLERITNKIYG